jgi:hypothetical protein
MLVFRSSAGDKQRTLEKLAIELEQSIAAGGIALGEVRAALKEIPRVLNADEAVCVPKIRFCNIDGEGRQGQVVR